MCWVKPCSPSVYRIEELAWLWISGRVENNERGLEQRSGGLIIGDGGVGLAQRVVVAVRVGGI